MWPLWGLAFKPNTDDIREAPALYMLLNELLMRWMPSFLYFDPEAMPNVNVRTLLGDTK